MQRSLVVSFALSLCLSAASAAPVFVNGLAPNWDQPNDYPDAFDLGRPAVSDAAWIDWCVPTSAAMLIGHWEDEQSLSGLADGSADGNQGGANTYGGPAWGTGSAWHDYTADGMSGGAGPAAARGTRTVNDFGWYMDTNRSGTPARGNIGAHTGTLYKDVAPGMNDFFSDAGSALAATSSGLDAAFGGFSTTDLANLLRTEIDNNRTAIAHFSHWNLSGPGGPGQGAGTETDESLFTIGEYSFDAFSGGARDEVWNGENGESGLGHAVLVVGYDTDLAGNVTDLIVHDNWPTTVRNVQIPVGTELRLITTVVPEPTSVGILAMGIVCAGVLRRRPNRPL